MKKIEFQKEYFQVIEQAYLHTFEQEYNQCWFEHCTFEGDASLSFYQCKFIGCDFSNGKFSNSHFLFCEFEECRFLGTDLSHSGIKESIFKDSMMQYSNFNTSIFTKVEFNHCDLTSASFEEIEFKKLSFDTSNLIDSEWLGTKMQGLDVSTCQIANLFASKEDVAGLLIAASQALEFIAFLNIKIKE